MMDVIAALLMPHGNVLPETTILVVIAAMLALAAVDVWRREVEDYAIIALFGIAVLGMYLEGIHPQQWIGSVLAAAIAFVVYLDLGVRGVLGGGDVKLSIVPAFVLGASNPVIGVWWIACAFLIHQGLFFLIARTKKSSEAIPHVPAMAAATIVASVAFPIVL